MILEWEPATEFEEVGTALFVARFWRQGLGKGITEKIVASSEKTSEKILGVIRAEKTVSARQVAKILGLTPRAVEHQIAKLRKGGFLKRIGPDKGGHWEVSGD